MARRHLFTLVVILAAAVFAGALAVSNTRALDSSATASADPAISFRLKQLDRFERSLRRQLATAPAASAPTTIYRPASAPTATSEQSSSDDDHAEYETDEDRDD